MDFNSNAWRRIENHFWIVIAVMAIALVGLGMLIGSIIF